MSDIIILLKNKDWHGLFISPTNNDLVQLFRYCFVGGLSFLIDFGCYFILLKCGVYYLLAGVIAFMISFAFNFSVSRFWVFHQQTKENVIMEIIPVVLISIFGLILTELLLWLGVDVFGLDKLLVKMIASILVLFWNYIARKKLVYHRVS